MFQDKRKRCILGVFLAYLEACSAAVALLGEDTQYFAADEPLSIKCKLTGSTSDIEFKFNSMTVVTCGSIFDCSRLDTDFNVTKVESDSLTHYILHTVANFDETRCGDYQCIDTASGNSDTVTAAYKNFSSDTYNVDEEDELLMISTTCVFPALSEFMNITWFSYTASLHPINFATLTSFIETVNESTNCSNVETCSSDEAKYFSFGLKFGKHTGKYVSALVEVHIVHSLFVDNPLVWRSTKSYPVIATVDPGKESDWLNSDRKIAFGVTGGAVFAVGVGVGGHIGAKIYKKTQKRKEEEEKEAKTKREAKEKKEAKEKQEEQEAKEKQEAKVKQEAKEKTKTQLEEREEFIKAVNESTLFAKLSSDTKIRLAKAAFFVKGANVQDLEQSDSLNFYIVVRDSVTIDGKEIAKNSGFGKISVIYGIGHTKKFNKMIQTTTMDDHNIYALPDRIKFTECNAELLGLAKNDYDDILMSTNDWKLILYGEILRKVIKVKHMQMLPRIAAALRPKVFGVDDPIVTKERAGCVLIMIEGTVKVSSEDSVTRFPLSSSYRNSVDTQRADRRREHDTNVDDEIKRFDVFDTYAFRLPVIARSPVLCVVLENGTSLDKIFKTDHTRWMRHGQYSIDKHIEAINDNDDVVR